MMTEQELLEWGRSEDVARKADLAKVRSQEDLLAAQKEAKRRRLAVGLSASQAVVAVKLAQRENIP